MQSIDKKAFKGAIWLVVLASILITFFSYLYRGDFDQSHTYVVELDEQTKLTKGAPVNINGVKVGRVTNITLTNTDYRILATLKVDYDYKIRKGSILEASNIDLMGTVGVKVTPSNNTEFYKDGDTLTISYKQDTSSLNNLIGKTIETLVDKTKEQREIDSLKQKLKELQKITEPFKNDTLIH